MRDIFPCVLIPVVVLSVLTGCPRRTTMAEDSGVALAPGTVMLDGEIVQVRWSDGDTFRIVSGDRKGTRARLSGFNTLEDYGPVHRWGAWTPRELYELAKAPVKRLSGQGWRCTSSGETDKYDRLLVQCPDLAETLIREGLAMVFAVDGEPDARLLEAQRAAQSEGRGMWRKGVPPVVVTSVHSVDEGRGYNRLVDTATGRSRVREHAEKYVTCQEVCEGQSCMVYVPYERRYKEKPECLR